MERHKFPSNEFLQSKGEQANLEYLICKKTKAKIHWLLGRVRTVYNQFMLLVATGHNLSTVVNLMSVKRELRKFKMPESAALINLIHLSLDSIPLMTFGLAGMRSFLL